MTKALPAVLAVDGGNSKTDVALVARDGTLLTLVRGPGVPHRLGDETLKVIDELIRTAVKLAGREHGRAPTASAGNDPGPDRALPGLVGTGLITNSADADLVASHLVACVANVDLPSEERQLERMLHELGWAGSTVVANDTYAVLRAGLDDVPAAGASRHWGVGVTCGTGINCIGNAPDGRTAGFLALGLTTGDWGGGGGLGLEAQWLAVRAADGRGEQTALRHTVPEHFGLTEPLDVAEAIHTGQLREDDLAGLVPMIFQVADAGDEVARGLVQRLAREIFLLAKSAITRLQLAAAPVPVVLGGGIVASGNHLLIETTTSLIAAEFPAADVRVLLQAPVAGSSLLGLDLAGAPVHAKRRLRDEIAARPPANPSSRH